MNVWVRFESGETRAFHLPVGRHLGIGCTEDNDVILPPPVEAHHAALRNENGALLMISLGRLRSSGVFKADGQKVERAPVFPGERFTMNRGGPSIEVFFEPETVIAPPPAPVPAAPPPAPAAVAPAATPPWQGAQPRYAVTAGLAIEARCPSCGVPLGHDVFICYKCRRTLCTTHYVAMAGVCLDCLDDAAPSAPGGFGGHGGTIEAPLPGRGGPTGTAPQMPSWPGGAR